MKFRVYRDLRSIVFVRCISRIPNSAIYAEGVAFTVKTALEKCRSEAIEAVFQLAHPQKEKMLGIAAHRDLGAAKEHARNEALETLLLLRLSENPLFSGFPIMGGSVRLWLGRIEGRFAALALFKHQGILTATQAVSKNPFSALLRAWAEVRNLRIYNPIDLTRYTKANRFLTQGQLRAIHRASLGFSNQVPVSSLYEFQAKFRTHNIVYYTQEAL